MTDKKKQRYPVHLVWLFLILFLAFSARIIRYSLDSRVEKDSVLYINMARDWNEKGLEHAFDLNPRIPPLYIYCMMIGEKSGIGAENAGVFVSILTGSLTVLSIFLLASSLMDKKLALIAAFLVAIHPVFIRMNAEVMRDNLFIFCYTSSLAFFAHGIYVKKIYWWCLGGIFASMATLTRSEGAELIMIPFVWIAVEIILHLLKQRREKPEEKFISSLTISCGTVLKEFLPGVLIAVAVFAIFSFPVQLAFDDTSSNWTVFDSRIMGYLKALVD